MRMTCRVLAIGAITAACAAPPYGNGRRTPLSTGSGISHEESRFEGEGGISLFEERWRPATGEPRATLVVMHGLKDHPDRYAAFAEELVGHGVAVYAFALRGHAYSAGDRVWVDQFSDYVADLDRFVARAVAREPGRPLFLLGHSMGGAIATLFAIEHPERLNGLILSAAALKPGKEVSGGLIAVTRLLASVAPKLAVFKLDDARFSRDPKVVEAMRADPLVYQGAGPARTARELLGALETIGRRMGEVSVPLLVLHGSDDQVTNPEGSQELMARAASQDKALKIYPGLVHDLLHEPERAEVTADIKTWVLTRTPASGQPAAH